MILYLIKVTIKTNNQKELKQLRRVLDRTQGLASNLVVCLLLSCQSTQIKFSLMSYDSITIFFLGSRNNPHTLNNAYFLLCSPNTAALAGTCLITVNYKSISSLLVFSMCPLLVIIIKWILYFSCLILPFILGESVKAEIAISWTQWKMQIMDCVNKLEFNFHKRIS